MSYNNGTTHHEQPGLAEKGLEKIREETVTEAEWLRFLACYDLEFKKKRVTDHCFECRGVRRVVTQRMGRPSRASLLTFEAVPDGKFHGKVRDGKYALGRGSKVTVSGEECYLDRPVIFRKQS